MRNFGTGTVSAIAVLLLAACGPDQSGSITTDDGEVNYEVDQDGEETSIQITGPDGTEMSMNIGSDSDVDLLPGFTIYPGAEVISNTVINQNDGQGILVSLKSSDSVEDMVSHYRQQAEAAGVAIAMEMKTGEMQMVGGESEGGLTFSFTATPAEGGSSGQLMLGLGLN